VNDKSTDAMQQFGAAEGPRSRTGAGLVLLYAENFAELPAAWAFAETNTVVGREASSDIVLPVDAVSRVHAEFVRERGAYWVKDRGSTNGTLVDGQRVTEARLEHEQEVRIGDAIFKFVQTDIGGYLPYRLDGQLSAGSARLSSADTGIVGGYQMDRIAHLVERIAESTLSVLVLGESGVGKEVVAQAIHKLSKRRGPFRAVNCAALPTNLLESELFGFKRGAFSGADRDKPGIIRAAHQGTLLLDEIGDMPLEAQAKLLRVLQSKELFPLGATEPEKVDVRVIGATHGDLPALLLAGKFRPDLYARLNEYALLVPPLRERKEDLYLLLHAFFERHGRGGLTPSFQFMAGLAHHDWPYNVRELEACAKRCVALVEGDFVGEEHLPEDIREELAFYGRPLLESAQAKGEAGAPNEQELRALLTRHDGNIAAVGRELGKARMQVHRWLKRYGIDLGQYRA
jgi:transcriptional regulator with GAF, ATPase, and Fis domain